MAGEWKQDTDVPWVTAYFVDGRLVAWLQPRPSYCDRGHWQVNADVPDLDGADGFPRYYMSRDTAVAETEAFIEWRLLKRRTQP